MLAQIEIWNAMPKETCQRLHARKNSLDRASGLHSLRINRIDLRKLLTSQQLAFAMGDVALTPVDGDFRFPSTLSGVFVLRGVVPPSFLISA